MRTTHFAGRLVAFVAAAVVVAVFAAACASPTPTPTPMPTATPTPTPAPTATPTAAMRVSGAVWGDLVGGLTSAETGCLQDRLGGDAYEALLQQPVFGGDAALWDIPLDCLEQGTAVEVIIGQLDAQTGGLSQNSASCLRETFTSFDIGLLGTAGAEPSGEDLSAVFGPAIGLAYCLTDEEAAAISVADITGEPLLDISIAQIVCVVERVDFEDIFAALDGSGGGEEDQSAALALFQALSECGIDLAVLAGGSS